MTTQHNCYTPATMLTGARSQGVWHSLITMPKDDDVPPMPAGMYGASIMNSDLVRIRVILTRYADFLQAGGFDPALPNADISTGERWSKWRARREVDAAVRREGAAGNELFQPSSAA